MIITGGKYNGRKLLTPDENITRPTLSKIRMGVFNTLYSILNDFSDKTFLDMFGGSGIMGLEALSRGFKSVTVYEKNPKAVQIIKKNYSGLDLLPDLYVGDSLKFIKKNEHKFDVVYIDPPYKSTVYNQINLILNKSICNIAVVEHIVDLKFNNMELIKSKIYGDKKISFFRLRQPLKTTFFEKFINIEKRFQKNN